MERFGQPEGARSGRAGERAAGREAALQAARQNERLTVFSAGALFSKRKRVWFDCARNSPFVPSLTVAHSPARGIYIIKKKGE